MRQTELRKFKTALFVIGIILIAILYFTGIFQKIMEPRYVTYETADGLYAFEFQDDWENKAERYSADLYCSADKKYINAMVFVYNKSEIVKDISSEFLIDFHVNDLSGIRKDFTLIEDHKTKNDGTKTVTTVLYSGIDDKGAKFYYRFSAISFAEKSDTALMVIQTVNKGDYKKYKDELEKITDSAFMKPHGTSEEKSVDSSSKSTADDVAEAAGNFDVELTEAGSNKIQVIKIIREVTGLGLKEAKDLMDAAPTVIKKATSEDDAESIKAKLTEAGAKVTVK